MGACGDPDPAISRGVGGSLVKFGENLELRAGSIPRRSRGQALRVVAEVTMSPRAGTGRAITLSRVAFVEQSVDPAFDAVHVDDINVSDLVAGNGSHKGYRVNTHMRGDCTFVTYEGWTTTTVTPAGLVCTRFAGTWHYTGGTGAFEHIAGGGTYHGHVTPTGRVYVLDGWYKAHSD
jgi:hypothetical protein